MMKLQIRALVVLGVSMAALSASQRAQPDEASNTKAPLAVVCPLGTVLLGEADVHLGAPDDHDALSPSVVHMSALCVDRTEVTVRHYRECVSAGKCPAPESTISFPGFGPPEPMRSELSHFCNAPRKDHEEHPMNCVEQATAETFCKWEGGRLLTEQEWEYTARGAEGRVYPWGNDRPAGSSAPLCWDRREAKLGTCEVGQFPSGAAASGALDMAGNVWEWTSSARDSGMVVRGGGWTNFLPHFVKPTYRWSLSPRTRLNCLGFRCARKPATP